MSEQSNESTEATETGPQEGAEQETKTFDAEYVEKLRKEAAKYRTEAKSTAAELEKVRKSSMSEAEKAVAEAEARGRTAAATDFGKRVAKAEIRAAAKEAGADLKGVFEYLDVTRFVGDDGEPNNKEIEAFVAALPRENTTPSYDGGSRTSPPAAKDMNTYIRQAAGRA